MNEPVLPKTSTVQFALRPYIGRNSYYIVRDLCAVLQRQMDALLEGGLDEFSETELKAYRLRQE